MKKRLKESRNYNQYTVFPKTFTAIMMLYKNKKAMVHLIDDHTDYFDILAGIFP